ncbi:MAG TPA: hypothetical protein VNQ76_05675 [Planctomicrobium sp.]|nr:hypothetical protein [Planctomicrobium sp.]
MQVKYTVNSRLMTWGLLFVISVTGCQKPAVPITRGMVVVEGEVTLDGTPVPAGRVVYIPKQSPESVPGGEFATAITNGKYTLELSPGAYRVEIFQFGESINDQVPQLLPSKFNTESTLTADISGTASSQINFSLQSTGK